MKTGVYNLNTDYTPVDHRGQAGEGRDGAVFVQLAQLEGPALLWIQQNLRGPLDSLVSLYTQLGNAGLLWIALSLAMLAWKPTRRAGLTALVAMVFGLLVTNLTIKPLLSRPRPWLDVPGLTALVAEHDPNSFPSGHTCAAFAAALSWRGRLPRRWMGWMGVAMAVCMGLSRLYVGVHYPSDVLAGGLIGAACAWAAIQVTDRLCTWWAQRKNGKGAL